MIVSASLQDLQAQTGMAMTGGGTQLPISDVIRMASHGYHYLSIFDGVGRRLWLGRTKRLASADQRIVLPTGTVAIRTQAARCPATAARSIMLRRIGPAVPPMSMIWPSPAGRTTGWSNTTGGPPGNTETAAPNGYRLHSCR